MTKYIHYCWFGGKPLPSLANKCIESWKKYLPDYKIIRWDESNSNLEECPFIKEAYEHKKWAFVADYIRTKAINEYGGIYFDTDMEVTKPIDELLNKKESFLGVEDSHMIACGVWYEPKPNSYLSKKMLNYYQKQEYFDIDNIYRISIPRIISSILKDFDSSKLEIQHLKHNITIYPRDYFYPLSYDHQYNVFTENTCMIHYYDASWTPKWEQRENRIFRRFGKKKGKFIIDNVRKTKRVIKRGGKLVLYPAILYKRYKDKITPKYLEDLEKTVKCLDKLDGAEYVAFCNHNWLGVTNATKELFDNVVPCSELFRKKDISLVCKKIKQSGVKEVVFSGFCIGWHDLAILLHRNGIVVKTYFHGSHSQVLESYGWDRAMEIYYLHKQGVVKQMATCKASLVDFYKNQGCDIVLLRNKVEINKNLKAEKSKNDKKIRIGIYAAKPEDYRKNVFSQLSAIKLLKDYDVVVDMVPMNKIAAGYAKLIGINVEGIDHPIPREDLIKRMSQCDIVLYVTFSECAPMMPLESFAVDTICITGNNHHYFKNTELEKYLVVNNECSVEEIVSKIKTCLINKDKILKLYKKWEKENIEKSKKGVEEFLSVGGLK